MGKLYLTQTISLCCKEYQKKKHMVYLSPHAERYCSSEPKHQRKKSWLLRKKPFCPSPPQPSPASSIWLTVISFLCARGNAVSLLFLLTILSSWLHEFLSPKYFTRLFKAHNLIFSPISYHLRVFSHVMSLSPSPLFSSLQHPNDA